MNLYPAGVKRFHVLSLVVEVDVLGADVLAKNLRKAGQERGEREPERIENRRLALAIAGGKNGDPGMEVDLEFLKTTVVPKDEPVDAQHA